jgi:hypothetical protein
MAEVFQSDQNIDDANKFWYEKLRTKALRKRLNQIEKELGFDQEASRAKTGGVQISVCMS